MSSRTEKERLSDEEFMHRLRARLIELAGDGADEVADAVEVSAWRSDGFEDDPEGAAEDEILYWGDDGDD